MATVPLRCNLRLSDVHATAETVGREFKELTDKFGMQCVMGLVPPVVAALECLEVYVESYQRLQTQLSELRMDNDTVTYEREQKNILAERNENLTEMVRELQRENKCLQMELDELHFKNKEFSANLDTHQPEENTTELVLDQKISESTPSMSPTPPPHSPQRHSTTSPPNEHATHSPLSHDHPPHRLSPSSPDHLPTSPLPSPNFHSPDHTNAPPVRIAHRLLQPVVRSSSLSDIRVQQLSPSDHDVQQDMCEGSRVVTRQSKVELETITWQLQKLQRYCEKLAAENKDLKSRLYKEWKAKTAVKNIHGCKGKAQKVKEAPRYYKDDVMQVLTEKNKLKEDLHSLKEELDEVKDALRKATTTNGRIKVATSNGMTAKPDERRGMSQSVRSILSNSVNLDNYVPPIILSHAMDSVRWQKVPESSSIL